MPLFGSGVEQWAALATALRLSPFEPTASYCYGTSFRQMKRALGVPAGSPPKFSHWLYGVRNGVEIIVLTFDVGSGSSARTYTGVVARIDPPLFLGLRVSEHNALAQLFGTTDVKFGDPRIDAKLDLSAFDATRAVALLSPHDMAGRALLEHTLKLLPRGMRVSDSVVVLAEEGTLTDPHKIDPLANEAATLATEYAARRRALPDTRAEVALHNEWATFADAHRFQFDPQRMKLDGNIGGSSVEMAIETEGQVARTTVTVRFPTPLSVAFTARRTSLPGFLQGLFHQDIKIGHPQFDEMFAITGYPEAHVRALLAKPEFCAMLTHVGARTTEVQLNHTQLHFSLPGACGSSAQLFEFATMAQTATTSFFGTVDAMRPYR